MAVCRIGCCTPLLERESSERLVSRNLKDLYGRFLPIVRSVRVL